MMPPRARQAISISASYPPILPRVISTRLDSSTPKMLPFQAPWSHLAWLYDTPYDSSAVRPLRTSNAKNTHTHSALFPLAPDATSSGEAANLQNRLRTLSTGLAGLRSSLHETGGGDRGEPGSVAAAAASAVDNQPNYCNINGSPPPPLPHENAAANSAVGVIAPIAANPPVGFQVGELPHDQSSYHPRYVSWHVGDLHLAD